ncbi:hypothetical protein [Arenibacter sp. F20364]|uniref:hypothetical protein n=1 Tax=Arenibacter sp. F20364 TaxID=2926415 RepID=UPI001FF21688|nr:hypothetical protein [Arenibacter sp. F20364]MCK0189702.1 hypothetical protein [Arenibacter sp. F20364]
MLIVGANDGAIEGAIEVVKEKLVILLTAIADDEGKRVTDYREKTKLAESSIERYMLNYVLLV